MRTALKMFRLPNLTAGVRSLVRSTPVALRFPTMIGARTFSSTEEISDYSKMRNVGISAHIDSGKTTTSERKIADAHDVKGKDGVGAKMDSMELERERGITIQSAASFCEWNADGSKHYINVIDTPGHVDFTVEVERALRVLDGGVLLLCGVAGVQSQTLTVFRQMQRYNVPRLVFINKLDRDGANPFRVLESIQKKVPQVNPVLMQVPIGAESKLQGVVDLISMKACYFEGYKGTERVFKDCPADLLPLAEEHRAIMLERLADLDDEFAELYLEETFSESDVHAAVRRQVIKRSMAPVFMGTAHKNKGIQNLLDSITRYLPAPTEVTTLGFDQQDDGKEVEVQISADAKAPLVAYAFKIQETPGIGQVTYTRIYQGTLKKGDQLLNMQTNKKVSAKKILKMHSDEAKEIDLARAGDIVALAGIDCASGTTFTDGKTKVNLQSMFVPEPVVQMSLIVPPTGNDTNKLSKALARFQKEDPTFKVHTDAESRETILSGMGELHIEVYVERMRREYGLNVSTGEPRVNFREAILSRCDFDYTHKRQTGGRGEYAKIIGYLEPIHEDERLERPFEFKMQLQGNVIPPNYFSSIEKGFKAALEKGTLSGCRVIGVKVVITDGQTHEVDSSDLAFRTAAEGVIKHFTEDAHPTILEPIMKVEVESPAEFAQAVLGTLQKRKGSILNSTENGETSHIEALVPLKDMFGYIQTLRAATQGQGEFAMDFHAYEEMPGNEQEKVIMEYQKRMGTWVDPNAKKGKK